MVHVKDLCSRGMIWGSIGVMILGGFLGDASKACNAHRPPVDCQKSVSLTKGVSFAVPNPNAATFLAVPVTLTTKTEAAPGSVCPNLAIVAGGSLRVTVLNGGTPVASGFVSIPPRGSGCVIDNLSVPVTLPPLANGIYDIIAEAEVFFSSDSSNPAQVYIATGDTRFSLVETLPGTFTPRLGLETLSSPLLDCGPGAQATQKYLITNNDPNHSVTLGVTASTRQNARMPSPGEKNIGVPSNFSISDPNSGDDFPICFVSDLGPEGILELPPNPSGHTQGPISTNVTIPPQSSFTVEVETRAYTGCADGSCAENLFVVTGFFDDGSPAEACVGGGVTVNSAMPPCPNASTCPDGTVGTGFGPPQDVLFVNGSSGNEARVVSLPAGSPISISLQNSPFGPSRAPYAFFAWAGSPVDPFSLQGGGGMIGCLVNPIPISPSSQPQPFRCFRGGLSSSLCSGQIQRQGPASAPWTINRNQGVGRRGLFTLQAILRDNGANNGLLLSTSNAVTVEIQ